MTQQRSSSQLFLAPCRPSSASLRCGPCSTKPAGVEEMRRSDRLFERVAPMGVNDIMMAVTYR